MGAPSESWHREALHRDSTPLALAALAYSQELGWPVFPCRPRGKEPLIAKATGGNGCRDASTHAEAVGDWWEKWPSANLGIATGGPACLLVLDVDGETGERALSRFGPLPATPEVRTARGRHLYFRAPSRVARCTTSHLGPKLDTRGSGGYVIAPPSLHPDGAVYTWREEHSPHERPLADLPPAVVAALEVSRTASADLSRQTVPVSVTRDREGVTQLRAWMARIPTGLRLGDGRNHTAYRIAARALETLTLHDAAALLATWNSLNAEPLRARDLNRILANAVRYARGRAA